MVNALEPSDLSAPHSRVPKFDFHLQSGGRGVALSKKLLLGERWPPLPIPNQSPAEETSCPSLSSRGGETPCEGRKEQRDPAFCIGKDRRLHTQTLHSHVSLGGAVFDCYVRGCVCIGNKIVL